MKTTLKAALGGAILLAGSALAATPADARVSVGIGIGVPGPYYGDPCYGPYPYPGYCASPTFYGPVFYEGRWWNGPHRWRVVGGHRAFWHNGHWVRARFGHGHWGGPHHGRWHHRH